MKSLNGQEHETNNYTKFLYIAYKISLKYGIYIGLALGCIWLSVIGDYGLGFWFGGLLIKE